MKVQLFSKLASAFLLVGIATAAHAQTDALVITSTSLDQKAKATHSVAYLKGDKMVAESGEGKNKTTMLFDAAKETMYIIDHKKKEVTEMTREDMEALNAMLQQQLAAMEQQLAMLPENQRNMIKEQMGAAFGGSQKPAEYTLEESGVNIKEWETDKYVGMADGKKQGEIYIASYDELGQKAEKFKVLGQFFETMKNYMQTMSKGMAAAGFGFFSESMPGYKEGVPVKTVLYNSKGEPFSTSTVESIAEKEVDSSLFIIPENYEKKKMENLAEY